MKKPIKTSYEGSGRRKRDLLSAKIAELLPDYRASLYYSERDAKIDPIAEAQERGVHILDSEEYSELYSMLPSTDKTRVAIGIVEKAQYEKSQERRIDDELAVNHADSVVDDGTMKVNRQKSRAGNHRFSSESTTYTAEIKN